MTAKTAGRVAWALFAVVALLLGAWVFFDTVDGSSGNPLQSVLLALDFLAMGAVGALVAARRSRNAIGWVFLGVMVLMGVAVAGDTYATYVLITRPGAGPGGEWVAWVSAWLWIPAIGSVLGFVPLLFPDGRLPSRRWRLPAWLFAAYLGFASLVFALAPQIETEGGLIRNPAGVAATAPLMTFLDGPGYAILLVFSIASVASLFLRFRRAGPEQRAQIKWFAGGAALLVLYFLVTALLEVAGVESPGDTGPGIVGAFLAILSLPLGVGVGILKHRLYDFDLVLNRALVFGILAGFITAVYVGIVVGIGAVVGSQGNLLLSIAATAVIAVAFQPIRERARHVANRLVFGRRATPYELLSEFAGRMGGTFGTEDLLPRMARVIGEGTGAARAGVWLKAEGAFRAGGSWPVDAERFGDVPSAADGLPRLGDQARAFPVRHQGELLGAITVTKPRGEALQPAEEKLVSDLAAQAGLVLRNVRLIEELKASRQRLVKAQDEERRRLERNIHDGAQQQLVALAIRLGLLGTAARKTAPRLEGQIRELQVQTQQALEDLRDLARGIYPPLLADQGLVAALRAQARKATLPVEIEADGVGRYPQEAEAAVYFCTLEALQNVAKYSEASKVTVRLAAENEHLRFSVEDDGRGFDPKTTPKGSGLQNMADRLVALGGELDVRSAPGAGATVSGRIAILPVGAAR